MIVPMLLRGNAAQDAPRPRSNVTTLYALPLNTSRIHQQIQPRRVDDMNAGARHVLGEVLGL